MTYKQIDKKVVKKDAMALLLGRPAYVADITPNEVLVVKILRSPYAHALVKKIDTTIAMKFPGIEAIYTYKDVPHARRFSMAGQTYPEPSPYDHLLLDQRLRYIGDAVAIIAGKNEKIVEQAMKLIKVEYEVLEPVLDFRKALDNPILVHPEDNWESLCPVGANNKRNLCASKKLQDGEVDAVMNDCDIVLERTYHTKSNHQGFMETFQANCEIDCFDRLHVISSTQIVFHARRIIANALNIPKSKVHVEKPRIGGGFGAKQTVVAEIYPAFVTWMTKKPSRIIYSRKECITCGSPRHEMEITVKIGAMKDGTIRAIDMYALSNTGAYGEHGPTTVELSGHKSLPLYTNHLEAFRFNYDVVYTNTQNAGAYRGYGAPQGIFAMESIVNELAEDLHIDPVTLRERNMVKEGQIMRAYYNEVASACALDRCMQRAKKMFDWDTKSPVRLQPNGKIRAGGIAMAMQGSCISAIDVGSATLKLQDSGYYTLLLGSADMGTGSDTILAQIAAETLNCDLDMINVFSADTDISPYDSGSYASSTTYITGKAVEMASQKLIVQLCKLGAAIQNCEEKDVEFIGTGVRNKITGAFLSLEDLGTKSMCFNDIEMQVTCTNTSPISPPPYMVGMVEIELDPGTGVVEILDYVAVVDCGTVINQSLATVQTEGGITQGIGMALCENVTYSQTGKINENSLMNYKMPTRLDIKNIRVAFESSYEPSGPYGAKSIGEVVINTPSPALAHAIYKITHTWFRELPITPEKISMSMKEK
ncbi:MAG: molybdopterin-dependent oxidoreductase [Synergistaceae bacterium]|nr:molybdopterin-dependent oxidoreductase [Synergistaceae bacterium]